MASEFRVKDECTRFRSEIALYERRYLRSMAKVTVLLAVSLLISLPLATRTDDDNPFADLASSILGSLGGDGGNDAKMEGLAAIGNIVGSLMQGDNAKNLGAAFGQNGGDNAAGILSGIGSLLGGKDGKIDPAVIGSMVSMFAQQMTTTEKPKRQKREEKEGDFDLEGMLNLASGLLGNKNNGGGLSSYLPLIMNSLNAEAEKRADEHKDHSSFLPPFLEKAHLYWDIFINSELGKTFWQKSGLQKVFKAFTGPDGKLSFSTMFKNFENHSFRRHWIKTAATYLTTLVMHVAKPEVYNRYLVSIEFLTNSFLDSQGLPKSAHFNVKQPEKSLTALVNYVLKKYMYMDSDVGEYVKPAVEYVKETLKMAETTTKTMSSRGDYNAIADRLTDTLNLEVIEPILRVYRAYQHSVKAPQCQEHLMCLVNRHHDKDQKGLPGFKAGLTKLSSLIASAALGFQNGGGFLDLYSAIQNDVNCEAAYPADCSAFHEHEMKVTTEVYHSEL
ncbi:unnamed protein product [Arctia plantaginis]|uniref:Uncharacterized protein n=1 Tax=Arctia plantaginis TaxID=874455 RepID=A0A8S1BKU9_ARCPL|nr:unnamed protein product [Arctia plantaginis]